MRVGGEKGGGGGGMQRVKQLRHMHIVIALVITTSNILLFVL